jgi:hypothetical protein
VDHQPTWLDVEASSAASTASWRRSRYVASSAGRVNDQVCRETLPPHDAGLRLFERDRGRLQAPPPEQLQTRRVALNRLRVRCVYPWASGRIRLAA